MRNLKRALSLALASVMLLGMMVVGAGAASYPDVSSEDNVEAIEVLNAVKVMVGKKGNFDPDAPVNRYEMAVITAKLLLGSEEADKYVVGSNFPFTDVPAAHWAYKYVAACYDYGVISGTSKTTYSGTQSLTATQAALIMMRALGYEELTRDAADWRAPVVKQANLIQLFKDVVSNPNAKLTRNDVAQLALNTLKSDVVVTIDTSNTVTTPDGTVVKTGRPVYNSITTSTAEDYRTVNQDARQQLVEKLYGKKLRLDDTATNKDDAGRPCVTWVYQGENVGKYPVDADKVYTVSASGSDATAKVKDMGINGYKLKGNSVAPVINGKPGSAVATLTGIPALTGDGVTVELFMDSTDAKQINDIVVTVPLLMKVAASTTARVTLSAESDITRIPGFGSVYVTKDEDLFDTLRGYEVDDYVLVNATYSITESRFLVDGVDDPQIIEGNITAVKKNSGGNVTEITLNGSPYKAAAVASTGVTGAAVNADKDATLWLDANGYVIHAKAATATTENFLYVVDSYQTLSDGKIVPMAKGIKTNGEEIITETASLATSGTLYKVTSTSNGVWTLAALAAGDTETASGVTTAAANKYVALTDGKEIKSSDRALTVVNSGNGTNGFNNYYATNVVFVYADTTNKTATVKTGVQAVGSISNSGGSDALAVIETNSSSDSTPVVKMVILKGNVATNANSDDLVYVKDATKTGEVALYNKSTEKYENVDTYTVYINGEKVEKFATKTTVAANAFYTAAESDSVADSYVLTSHAATSGTAAVVSAQNMSASFDNRLLTVATITNPVDATKAIITDLRSSADQDNNPITLSAKGLCEAQKTYSTLSLSVVYDSDKGEASHIYVLGQGSGYTITNNANSANTITGIGSTAKFAITSVPTNAKAGDTVTVEVTMTVEAVASAKVNVMNSSDVLCTVTFAPDATTDATATATFTMPAGNVTLTLAKPAS